MDFHWHVLDKGVQHVNLRPRTPRLNGKGREIIDNEEFHQRLRGVVIDDAKVFNETIKEWEHQLRSSSRRSRGADFYERRKQIPLQRDPYVTRFRHDRVAEGVGFEPTVGKPTPVFKTGTFGRSVIPPGTTLVDRYFFLWRR